MGGTGWFTKVMPDAVMTLQYEGDAVDAGTMDVRQLAPALLAAADAVREAHLLLRVPGPAPQIEVRGARPGSFVIDLLVADGTFFQRTMDLLISKPVTASLDLGGLVGIVVNSIGLVRRIANRKIASTQEVQPGLIRLILDDGTAVETPPESFQLVLDAAYRRSVRGMVEPLAGDRGVSRLTARADDQAETVTSNDLHSFEVPPTVEEDFGESVSEVVLRPVNVSFTEGNKWRFFDGENTFFALIEDPRFLADVDLGTERFAKNDMLRVKLRTRQTRDASGLHTERTITEVVEHISGEVQLDLFASSGDAPSSASAPESD
jgi:hypothetical protein